MDNYAIVIANGRNQMEELSGHTGALDDRKIFSNETIAPLKTIEGAVS